MNIKSLLELFRFGITTILFKRKDPLVGSLILTDRCNLACKHCAVGNLTGMDYSYAQIRADMEILYAQGVRILFFYGGEPFLWRDQGKTLRELVIEAKGMGFILVSVVTNGTFPLTVPEADWILVSLDGGRVRHNEIRGDTYDLILDHIQKAAAGNICLYMAINKINLGDIETVCEIAKTTRNVRAVSFNFHTPYPGTELLKLSLEEKQACCLRIANQMEQGTPVLNLKSALPSIAVHGFKTPCWQCVVMENGKQWVCGRCIDIPGLCEECGFFFAAEFSLLFSGKARVVLDMIKTYGKFILSYSSEKK